MKRVTQELLNDHQPVKKAKVDLDGANGRDNASGWSKVEKKKKKKETKAGTGKTVTYPRFMYSNHDIVKRNHAISIDELRDFILYLVADAPQQSWFRVENLNLIQRVVVVFVPGLTPEILSLPPVPTSATLNPNLPISIPLSSPPPFSGGSDMIEVSTAACLSFIATTFSHACPTRAPGDQNRLHSVMNSFFTGPVSSEEKKRRDSSRKESETHNADPTQYLLSLEQMIENDYPIPSYMADIFPKSAEWLESPEPSETESKWKQKIYAIDCEMCMTEDGKELTRICMIDFATGTVVYDQLVKPAKPILDYLTKWSGITAEALCDVTTTFQEVQAEVMRLLSPPTLELKPNPFVMNGPSTLPRSASVPPSPYATPILVGHSLESDLKALKICHPRCIDTALLYHHPRGRPLKPGLAWLTKKWCGRQIQTRGEGGHDPEEDAGACVDLLKLKLEHGPGFGEYKVDYQSIFERMGNCDARGGGGSGGAGKVRSAVVDHGNPSVMHGAKANTAIGCKTDDEVLEGMIGAIASHQFTYGRFLGLANALGWITPKASPDVPPPTTDIDPPPSPVDLAPVLSALNDHLTKLHRALPTGTAFVIFTGHSDPRKMALLNARKTAFETAYRGGKSLAEMTGEMGLGWTTADARDLEEAVELARRGLLFLGIKQ